MGILACLPIAQGQLLWILVSSFLGEASLAELILIVNLKIECGYIVEYYAYLASQDALGMLEADLLDKLFLAIIQFVHIAVDIILRVNLLLIAIQILSSFKLALGID